MLVQHLPPNSAVAREIHGHDWTQHWQWLLADIRDTLADLLVLTHNVNKKQGSAAASRPKRAWRPEVSDEARALADEHDSDTDELRGGDDPEEAAAVTAELQATADRIFTTH